VITRERLEKILSWREKYGDDHNVMLTAAEAEEMARRLLAAEAQKPVRYLNKFTGVCVTLEQQPDAATGTAVYVPLFAAPQPLAVPDDDKTNMLCDSAYVNGLQAGFSMGQMNQEAEYAQTVEHYRKGIREYRAAHQPSSGALQLVGEEVARNHPNHERSVDFRWLDFNIDPGTKLYAIKQERN